MTGAGFWVNPQALAEFAQRLSGMAEQSGHAARYVRTQLDLPPTTDAGVLNTLEVEHSKIQHAADHAFSRLDDLFTGSSTSMSKAGDYYASTDRLTAYQTDASYPSVKAPGHPSQPAAALAGPVIMPIEIPILTKPQPLPEYPNPLDPIQQMEGAISPAHELIIPILTRIVGFNPIDAAIRHFNGDWKEFSACADGWQQLQSFVATIGDNLARCTTELGGCWSGNAADAAWNYFVGLNKAVTQIGRALGQLASGYQTVAALAYNAAADVSAEIETMIDGILVALVTASAILQAGGDVPDDFLAVVTDGAEIPKEILALGAPDALGAAAAAVSEMGLITAAAIVGLTAPTSYPIPHDAYTFPP